MYYNREYEIIIIIEDVIKSTWQMYPLVYTFHILYIYIYIVPLYELFTNILFVISTESYRTIYISTSSIIEVSIL